MKFAYVTRDVVVRFVDVLETIVWDIFFSTAHTRYVCVKHFVFAIDRIPYVLLDTTWYQILNEGNLGLVEGY